MSTDRSRKLIRREARSPRRISAAPTARAPAANDACCVFVMTARRARRVPPQAMCDKRLDSVICHLFAPSLSCCAMLPARWSRAENALDAALERLAPGRVGGRPDTPDLHVTAMRRLPVLAAQHAPFPADLDRRLTNALEGRGITQLYTHQAEAIEHAIAGRNVVVTTPTASGKTLCYNAPVLNAVLQNPSSRALYLFPTKALAQDQLAELQT